MKQIGEFANDNQVTVKALRHYEKLGLIMPSKVDEFTGYRYYEDEKSDELKTIGRLKSLGFSLSEIKSVIERKTDKSAFMKMLFEKKKQAEIDSDTAQIKFRRISDMLQKLDESCGKFDIREILSMDTNKDEEKIKGIELFNHLARMAFEDAAKNSKPLCVMSADIDRFKKINDDFGHDIGDIVIERVMNTALSALDWIDSENILEIKLIAREYGDEFKIVVSLETSECEKLAQHIIDEVAAIDFNDVADGLNTSVSAGIASVDAEPNSMGKLFHLAETALFDAKEKKRGTYSIYSE